MMIATLGTLAFYPKGGSFDELTLDQSFDWATQKPLGGAPVMQFSGKGEERITINGESHLETQPDAGQKLTALAELAGNGYPLPFTLGVRVFGLWCVTRISRTGTNFNQYSSPGILSFTLELERYQVDG